MRLFGRLLNVPDLSAGDRQAMLALMDRHYAGVCPTRFAEDLADKDWVIGLYDQSQRLLGFSTQTVLHARVSGRPVRALFSGDTIVDREHWGDPALSHIWGRLALALIDQNDGAELFWFLISKGFRTYRFLPVFFQEFYPRHDQPTPASLRALLETLASERFGSRFDAERGVLRAGRDEYCLRESLATVSAARRRDPHVEFFLQANPQFAAGDELCCLAPLSRENFTPAAWRVIHADGTGQRLQPCPSPLV